MGCTLRVLIVDDQGSMRSLLKKMLLQMGCFQIIEEAADGEDAWSRLRTQAFDLVIVDVNMPRLGGIGLLKRCRGENDMRDLPFLMISGDAMPEVVAYASEWGAYDYIVKPFSFNILKSHIMAIMERWRSPEESFFREAERLKEEGYAQEALEKVEDFEKSMATPKTRWLNLKGECLIELDRIEEAAASIEKALQLSDHYLAAHKSYAVVHQKLGNTEKAIEALEKADSLSPTGADRKITLGKLLMKCGREEEGKKYLDRVLKMPQSDDTEANRLKVAGVYLESGRFEEAEKLYLRALKDNPEESEALNRLGIALRRQGKFQQAEAYYQLALKSFPENPAIHYNLGVLNLNLQNKTKAVAHLKKSLEFDPDFEPAQRLLENMTK